MSINAHLLTKRKGSSFDLLGFQPAKINGKRVAICDYCQSTLCNTGYNRLNKHRFSCFLKPNIEDEDPLPPVVIKVEKTEESHINNDIEEQLMTTCSKLCDNKELELEIKDATPPNEKVPKIQSDDENTDVLFLQSMLALMRDLPIDVKDDFQCAMYQKVYKLRAQQRSKRSTKS